MKPETVLFALLREAVCGAAANDNCIQDLSPELAEQLFELARQHDLAHIAGHSLQRKGAQLPEALQQKFARQVNLAIYRSLQLQRVYTQVCQTLEQLQVEFIPLKGSVIRSLYPEGWMRTSSDIDILLREKDIPAAVDALVKLGYENKGRNTYDVSVFSPAGMHVELHFNLITDYVSKRQGQILSRVWEESEPVQGQKYHRRMSDGLFYFFHMAHMAKHIHNGGCGVRPLLDTWLLNHRLEADRQTREVLLEEGGLLTFARQMENLAEVWFSGKASDETADMVTAYILDNGVYGTRSRGIANKQTEQGRGKYFLSRIFVPYGRLKLRYPVLQKHKWLLPFYEVARWFGLLFNGGVKRAAKEVRTGQALSEEERLFSARLLTELGLNDR